MKIVEFEADAEKEMIEASRFYEERQFRLGITFLEEIGRVLRRISKYPESGTPITENIRRTLTKKFPYAVLYAIQPRSILVVAVMHTKRKPGYWRERLK